jgi:hypothetical protein
MYVIGFSCASFSAAVTSSIHELDNEIGTPSPPTEAEATQENEPEEGDDPCSVAITLCLVYRDIQ